MTMTAEELAAALLGLAGLPAAERCRAAKRLGAEARKVMEAVQDAAVAEMKASGILQAAIAEAIGETPQAVSRRLSAGKPRRMGRPRKEG